MNIKIQITFTWAATCARYTGKPVENEDAGEWNAGGENINRVER